jgi:hypothetical protein
VISVVIPTVAGREQHLERCVRAYEERTLRPPEIIVIENRPTCGIAWQEGAEKATGAYIHFSADDLEPHPGWDKAAMVAVAMGWLPAPRILRPDGSLESCGRWEEEQDTEDVTEMTRIPFMSRQQWKLIGPMIDTHYYTDNWISFKGRLAAIETRVHRHYLFTHHWAQEGRGAGMTQDQRMLHDQAIYEQECAKWTL